MEKWGWYTTPHMVHLFMHLVSKANYKDSEWRGRTIKRGQCVVGRRSLSKATGITTQMTRTCLERLKSTREVTLESTNKFTIVTIVEYEKFQSNEKDQPTNQPAFSPTSNQQLTTSKEGKESKEESSKIPKKLNEIFQCFVKLGYSNSADQLRTWLRDLKNDLADMRGSGEIQDATLIIEAKKWRDWHLDGKSLPTRHQSSFRNWMVKSLTPRK